MKKQIILTLITLFLLQSCSKKEPDYNEALPPATQTGAGTFACHVNGKAYIDKSGGWFNCFYQYVNGKYYFSISSTVRKNKGNHQLPWGIGMGSIDMTITEGIILELSGHDSNLPNAGGDATFSTNNGSTTVFTDYNINKGELKITKMDYSTGIISGTFWFDVKNPNTGKKVKIRDGRFDTKFTM